jgi:hypothetical protein
MHSNTLTSQFDASDNMPGDKPSSDSPLRRRAMLLVLTLLALSTLACSILSSPEALNDGKGSRENPVPLKEYAKTIDFDVRALSAVWINRGGNESEEDPQEQSIRIQLQVRCTKQDDEVCVLEDIRDHVKLVDGSGILYEPGFAVGDEKPLEGEILGEAEKSGWVMYRMPYGVEVASLVVEYGEDQRLFFELP